MLNVDNLFSAQRIKDFLTDNNIEIVHFIPGRIRLKVHSWQSKKEEFFLYIEELKKEKEIISVAFTPETSSLLINYNQLVLRDLRIVEGWLSKVENLSVKNKKG